MSLFRKYLDDSVETRRIGLLFSVAGGSYPIWWLLAPAAVNPYWPWLTIGLVYVVLGFVFVRAGRIPSPIVLALPMSAVTLHQQVLFWLNPSEAFFAVASVMSVVATLPLIRGNRIRIAYSVMVLGVSAAQLIMGSGGTSFLGVGLAWLFVLLGGQAVTQEKAFADLSEATKQLARERTERKRLERELQTAQRMDSLGRLAGAFSHEFNNQLMAIRIHADLLERGLPKNAPQRRDVEQIQQTTSAAADLTSRLLAFSRPTRTREDPAELGAVLRQNALTLRHLLGEQIALTINAPQDVLHVPIGAKQLGQILLNLALNARDALPSGGSLRVELARIPRSSVELPVEMPSESVVRLTIADSGIGMNAEVRDRLFEPFFTTKAGTGSSGLGLSVVYGLVKDSGGHIRVTSEPSQGARFDIYWPLVAAAAPRKVEPTVAAPVPRRARVLLVEDQAVLRDGLTRWLGDQGYAVVSCESAEEALVRANDVDVIASDVVLRGMDGIELLNRLRRTTPALPAVLFSGHLDHLATQRREVPPGVRFLEKPFAPEVLLSTLEALVEGNRSATLH
jgi:signal transduction histidine kinase/ActR/RegA family two-component response regulator